MFLARACSCNDKRKAHARLGVVQENAMNNFQLLPDTSTATGENLITDCGYVTIFAEI